MDIPRVLPSGTYKARILSYIDGRLCWEITEGEYKGEHIFGTPIGMRALLDEPQEIIVEKAKA